MPVCFIRVVKAVSRGSTQKSGTRRGENPPNDLFVSVEVGKQWVQTSFAVTVMRVLCPVSDTAAPGAVTGV